MIIMVRIAVLVKMIWLPSLCQIAAPVIADADNFSSAYFITRERKRLADHLVKKIESTSFMSCSHSCLRNSWCTSTNFIEFVGQGDKGTCELNKHEFAPINDDNKLIDQPGSTFTMMMKGCLMTGCLNGGSCLFDKKNETFTCSSKLRWGGALAKSVITCQNKVMQINCDNGNTIAILSANYCRLDWTTCPNSRIETNNCRAGASLDKVKEICQHKESCNLFAGSSLFGDPCYGTFKYLLVEYKCDT